VTHAGHTEHEVSSKAKTGLILLSIAAAFFFGIVLRHWLW
jgi:hypothetical protein